MSWRTGSGVAGVAIAETFSNVSIDDITTGPSGAGSTSPTKAAMRTQRTTRSHVVSGIAHRRWRLPGRLNARVSSAEAPFLDIGQGGQDDRPDERQDPAQPRPDAALRVEAARPLALPDDRGTLDEGRDGLDRRDGDEGGPRRTRHAARDRGRTRADRWSG